MKLAKNRGTVMTSVNTRNNVPQSRGRCLRNFSRRTTKSKEVKLDIENKVWI